MYLATLALPVASPEKPRPTHPVYPAKDVSWPACVDVDVSLPLVESRKT